MPNRILYEGHSVNGFPDGKGKIFFYSKNASYSGEFTQGFADGNGTFSQEN